jgi:hypothetical protein
MPPIRQSAPRPHRTDDSIEEVVRHLGISRKRVCIVGNAESLFARNYGPLIDAHDVIVRMNRGFIRTTSRQGERTDIVTLSSLMSLDELQSGYGRCRTVWMTPRRAALTDAFIRDSRLVFYPRRLWRLLSRELGGARPSTGLMTIDLIARQCDAAGVTLVGFDFKRTKTFYDGRNYRSVHDWSGEKAWVRAMIADGVVVACE